ncbi:Uncharacterised protein [Vibrio cholerae]|nr:Uncharacterised protein [Vibrio cholerae]CSC94292.1 Uncharacterised protein [Vibrio cholerae]
MPRVAIIGISRAVKRAPRSSTTSFWRMSSPVGRILSLSLTSCWQNTTPSSVMVACSCMITASQPAGICAPVIMRTQVIGGQSAVKG